MNVVLSSGFVSLFSVLLFLGSGCVVRTGASRVQGPVSYSEPAGPGQRASRQLRSAQESAQAGCEFPANHCLPADIYLVDKKAWNGNFSIAHPARQTVAPGPTGEASFMRIKNGTEVVTKFYYASRPAVSTDLAIGRVVIASPNREQGIHRAPTTTKKALNGQWLVVRILDVSTLGQGYVLTSGKRRVAVDGMRVFDADSSARVQIATDVDKHYLSASHYLIDRKALPEKGYSLGHVGIAVVAPNEGASQEGHFYNAHTGIATWTPHAWLTRAARPEELSLGTYVFYSSKRSGGLYVSPTSREESLNQQWFVAKVVDVAPLYKGVVRTSAGHEVSVKALRVMR